MLNNQILLMNGAARNLEVLVITALLSIPIVIFSVPEYDVNPTFLLAPLIAILLMRKSDLISNVYIFSGICGVASIFIANIFTPDGNMLRHCLSLTLIMFTSSFVFLGRYLIKKVNIQKLWFYLALCSTLFVFVITVRLFILGELVRIYINIQGLNYSAMNAKFLNLPVFGAYGVLSLADLICLQSLIICGAVFSDYATLFFRCFFVIIVGCCVFLVMGSDSRGAQLLILWILGTIGIYTWLYPSSWRWLLLIIISILIGGTLNFAMAQKESRMSVTIKMLMSTIKLPGISPFKSVEIPKAKVEAVSKIVTIDNKDKINLSKQVDRFTSGRLELAVEGLKQIIKSPLIGNGFSGYSRLGTSNSSSTLEKNTSTHIYYLTLLWKGGLLFFIPFMTMILMNFSRAWKLRVKVKACPEWIFAWATVIMAFIPMVLTWDILIVPSAGALAFFLLGVISEYGNSPNETNRIPVV